ncbi:MAG: amidohydrolase [Stackebrandtia sp.]
MSEKSFVLRGGKVLPIDGDPVENGALTVRDGRVESVAGPGVAPPADLDVVDVSGKWIVPGFIDAHVHMGVYEESEGWEGRDSNELTDPVGPHLRAVDAINPAELGFGDAVAAGVLAVNIQPGSGNVIGGQTAAVKCVGRTVDEMALKIPSGLKSALGENPKRIYGEKDKAPGTRMGVAALIRGAFVNAQNYQARLAAAEPGKPAERDLKLEALSKVLNREIPWRQHCHRADDIATALRIADEFGYRIVIDHGTEAHLVADLIAARGIPVVIGPLMVSRTKVEVRNRSVANPAKLAAAGIDIALTTDHPVVPIAQYVTQAVLAVKEGLSRDAALRAMTLNPARVMGVDDRIGSLTAGKDADFCVWSGDPLDVNSRVEVAYVDGLVAYQRQS